jgi:hypothetical protein
MKKTGWKVSQGGVPMPICGRPKYAHLIVEDPVIITLRRLELDGEAPEIAHRIC